MNNSSKTTKFSTHTEREEVKAYLLIELIDVQGIRREVLSNSPHSPRSLDGYEEGG